MVDGGRHHLSLGEWLGVCLNECKINLLHDSGDVEEDIATLLHLFGIISTGKGEHFFGLLPLFKHPERIFIRSIITQ